MLALEAVRGVRVVAEAGAIDRMVVADGAIILRFAPDEAFVVLPEPGRELDEADPKAIVVDEAGFVGAWLTPDDLAAHVVPHIDWALPAARPVLAQGLIAGVPAKLWLETGRALLLCATAYAFELAERLR